MNSSGPSTANRPILVVLSLILVCLVLLVLRAYMTPEKAAQPAPVAVATPAPERSRGIVFVPAGNAPDAVAAPASEVQQTPIVESPTMAFEAVADPVSQPVALILLPLPASGAGVAPSGGQAASIPNLKDLPEIMGTVTLRGIPKPEIPIDLGPNCGRLNTNPVTTRHYVVNSEGRLANVFIYIRSGLNQRYPVAPVTPLLDQVGCMFEPYILGMQAGQKFNIRNADPEMHNIHATPRINSEFNFGQPIRGQVNGKTFDQPELFVRIKCDVHPWMFAYVCVLDHPFFAVTDANGEFRLPRGFPAGKYTVAAAHLKSSAVSGAVSQEITVTPGERKTLHFEIKVPEPAQANTRGGGALWEPYPQPFQRTPTR